MCIPGQCCMPGKACMEQGRQVLYRGLKLFVDACLREARRGKAVKFHITETCNCFNSVLILIEILISDHDFLYVFWSNNTRLSLGA